MRENFEASGSAEDGSLLFRNCAALNNALLNAYKDGDSSSPELAQIIEDHSVTTAKYMEIASLFTIAATGIDINTIVSDSQFSLDDQIAPPGDFFDPEYFELLSYYTDAVENASLITVEIDESTSAFTTSLYETIEICRESISEFCDLGSELSCLGQLR